MELSSFRIHGLPVIEHIPKQKLSHAFEMIEKIDRNIETSIRKNESLKTRKYLRTREIVTEYVVAHNFDLVFRVAEDYCYAGREYGHILCECNIGLIHSVDDYKPVNVLKFQTFAEYKIRESVLHYIFRHHPLKNFPLNSVKLLEEINRIDAEYFSVHGVHPAIGTLKIKFSPVIREMLEDSQKNASSTHSEIIHIFLKDNYDQNRIYLSDPLSKIICDSFIKLDPHVQSLFLDLFGMIGKDELSKTELEKKHRMYHADMLRIQEHFLSELDRKLDKLIVLE